VCGEGALQRGGVRGGDRGSDRAHRLDGGDQAHEDARGAEAALTGPVVHECLGPPAAHVVGQPVEGGDLPARHTASGGDARRARVSVDPHRAAAALTLRAAPVFDRSPSEPIAKQVEQGAAVVGDLHRLAVDGEAQNRRHG
jgi:hypothetical protein